MAAPDLAVPPRTLLYAVGVRARLNRQADEVGLGRQIPKYGLVQLLSETLADALSSTPAEHGRQLRAVCAVCQRWKPVTLHWSPEARRAQVPCGLVDPRRDLVLACRQCACSQLELDNLN
jgi:hypothetical protein